MRAPAPLSPSGMARASACAPNLPRPPRNQMPANPLSPGLQGLHTPGKVMNNGKAVVLVVEDSTIIRMGAVDLVLSAGYEALEACDAEQAICILESRDDVDLVFT